VYVVLAARFVAVATALPFDHRYVFTPAPPTLDAVADPVVAPWQTMCVEDVILATSKSGCVIVTLAVERIEQLSVTETVYVP
jgi:hypothetical protein